IGLGLNKRAPDVDISLTLTLLFPQTFDKKKMDVESIEKKVENFIRLGYKYSLEGDWTNAGEAFYKASELDPTNTKALNNMGSAYLEIGKYKEAKEVFERAVSLAPNDPDIHYNLGLAYLKLDDLLSAKHSWEKTLSLNPAHEGASRNLRILSIGGIGE
ncbi:MAG: tetratricopeptide repeat protein, partial [Candidatus Hydrogenedentota bacterium]